MARVRQMAAAHPLFRAEGGVVLYAGRVVLGTVERAAFAELARANLDPSVLFGARIELREYRAWTFATDATAAPADKSRRRCGPLPRLRARRRQRTGALARVRWRPARTRPPPPGAGRAS